MRISFAEESDLLGWLSLWASAVDVKHVSEDLMQHRDFELARKSAGHAPTRQHALWPHRFLIVPRLCQVQRPHVAAAAAAQLSPREALAAPQPSRRQGGSALIDGARGGVALLLHRVSAHALARLTAECCGVRPPPRQRGVVTARGRRRTCACPRGADFRGDLAVGTAGVRAVPRRRRRLQATGTPLPPPSPTHP